MIGGVIIAGGQSRRFGTDKRLAILPDGTRIIEKSVQNAASALASVIVALRDTDKVLAAELTERFASQSHILIIRAEDSALGMGHTLANAIEYAPDWDAALILLADMPFISASTFQQLGDSFTAHQLSAPIIVPVYQGREGHPVLFSKHYFAEIGMLTGDKGARRIIQRYPERVVHLPVSDPGVIQDIDTPEDLLKL
ncbi:MAG: nucleotidyltransferase family protein [Pseudomonadales bacterium]|nr:nucleotidyltransferase family protein [Pseudomonadales bacterium]